MIGSFLAQGAQPVQAAVCGVYLHAAAGDAAERQLTAYGMLPSDVIGCIPAAFRELLRI
jgi:NAD(P)H-hydrate epimerase